MRRCILGVFAFFLLAAPARAGIVQDFSGFTSGTNGIALGPDGNFWVAEENETTVARMTPTGQILNHFTVGAHPTSITTGPNNTVWVTVTGADKLVWFDATAAVPTAHNVSTAGQSSCGPVAIADGGNQRMYYSLPQPSDGSCNGVPSRLGSVSVTNAADVNTATFGGAVFDIAISGSKLWVADYENDTVRRVSLALTQETTVSVTGNPDGIAIDGAGVAWVTEGATGKVARFATGGGAVQEFTLPNLQDLFGIVVGKDGNVYAAGTNGIGRIAANGTVTTYAADGHPFEIVNGADGDFYITDRASSRVRRFVSSAPRTTAGAAAGVGVTTATISASVDSRGNATDVAFDYGPAGTFSATVTVPIPSAAGAAPVSAVLSGLTPGTAYQVRVRATNADGTTTSANSTFTTAPGDGDGDGVAPPLDCNDANAAIHPGAVDKPGDKIDQDCSGKDAAFPVLGARANFSWGFSGSRTAFTKVTVSGLKGGETIKITCKTKSKGCPFSSKTYKKVKKGTKSLTSLLGRKRLLKTGAKVEVRVTATAKVGSSATATVGKRKRDPKISRKRINP